MATILPECIAVILLQNCRNILPEVLYFDKGGQNIFKLTEFEPERESKTTYKIITVS